MFWPSRSLLLNPGFWRLLVTMSFQHCVCAQNRPLVRVRRMSHWLERTIWRKEIWARMAGACSKSAGEWTSWSGILVIADQVPSMSIELRRTMLCTRQETPPRWLQRKLNDSHDYGRIDQCYFTHDFDPTVGFWSPVPICEKLELPRVIKIIEFETTAREFRLGETRRTITRICALDSTVAGVFFGNMTRRTRILCV